jgi:hypothetical protein
LEFDFSHADNGARFFDPVLGIKSPAKEKQSYEARLGACFKKARSFVRDLLTKRPEACRRWLPRQIDIDKVSDEEIQDIVLTANLTPRKCLGFKTPFRESKLAVNLIK